MMKLMSNHSEIYFMSLLILSLSVLIAFNYEKLILLGVIGHTFLFMKTLYPKFEKTKIYILIGHFLMIIGFGMRLEKRYHGHIIPSIIGSIAHSLFFANFIKNIFNLDDKLDFDSIQKYKKILFLLAGLANIGLSGLYYVNYSKKNCGGINDEYEKYSDSIYLISVSIILFFFFTKLYEDRNSHKVFSSVIMSVYYSKSLFSKIF